MDNTAIELDKDHWNVVLHCLKYYIDEYGFKGSDDVRVMMAMAVASKVRRVMDND
ncbi:MAG: hypothetical protein VW496_03440 [Pelagibacteraceae bacterium]